MGFIAGSSTRAIIMITTIPDKYFRLVAKPLVPAHSITHSLTHSTPHSAFPALRPTMMNTGANHHSTQPLLLFLVVLSAHITDKPVRLAGFLVGTTPLRKGRLTC